MKTNLSSFLVGFIFAIGLGISGMTQPQKVVGFLNIFGSWDPSLIFVMLGAIATHFITYKLIRKRSVPLLSADWHVPTKKEITPALVVGAILFGIGWGLGGLCPGPALVSTGSGSLRAIVFVISMIAGMYLFRAVDKKVKFRK
jgi:uncharacterized membrane protein YedE/YeeE